MTALPHVEPVILSVFPRSPEGLVIRIQAARLEGRLNEAARLLGDLMGVLQPTFKEISRRFPPHIRGSVHAEDLQQVAAIEALRFVEKYDHTLATTRAPFRDHVYRRALSACEEHVRMHSADVHVSDWQARGRSEQKGEDGKVRQVAQNSGQRKKVEKLVEIPVVVSSDEPAPGQHLAQESQGGAPTSAAGGSKRYDTEQVDETTPEALLLGEDTAAAVREALRDLVPFRAKLIRQVYGIGCTSKSVAELARELSMPRRRLDDALQAALVDLRKALRELS